MGILKFLLVTREMSQWLRELDALYEGLGSVPSTRVQLRTTYKPCSKGSVPSSDLYGFLHTHGTHLYRGTHIHIRNT